ncbi:MAG TPA: LPS export ABC transporter permease LptG [Gammaproteobacteria bacterium]|nr:LPS export ABC transporter permease LptG [Gammaproteobacteria bacterium]
MVSILDRYVGRTIASATGMVLIFLVAAFSFFAFLDELDQIGRNRYGVLAAMEYVLLRMPVQTYQLFPIAALIGTLLGLGWLVNHSEMVVIRAAGLSLARTIQAIMKTGFILMIATLFIGEFIAPPAEQEARDLRSVALFDEISLKTRNGFWARDGNSFINIRKVLPGNHFEGIYLYEFDAHDQLRTSTYAQAAQYTGGKWLLSDIGQTVFTENQAQVHKIARAAWESLLKPEIIGMVIIDPNSLSLWDLANTILYLRKNAENTLRYELALWSKLVYPMATAAMVFLAITMVFASARATSVGARVLVGSLVGVIFHIISQAAGNVGLVYNLNPALCVLTPTVLILGAGMLLLRRVN